MKTNPSFKIFKFSTLVLFAAVVAALCLIPVTGRAAQIFVSNFTNVNVGKYNATTGEPINSSFISSELFGPAGLALSGGNLFVVDFSKRTIGKYNATTGETINSSFISSGLNNPFGIAVSAPDASPTLILLLLGVGATFGLNFLIQRHSEA
jgi:hypothetical protein